MSRLVTVIILVPIAIVVIALAVANRMSVPFTIDPFNPGSPGLTMQAPLFVYLFAALALGIVIGGVATWLRQGRFRKAARLHENEARQLRDRLARPTPPPPPALPGA